MDKLCKRYSFRNAMHMQLARRVLAYLSMVSRFVWDVYVGFSNVSFKYNRDESR